MLANFAYMWQPDPVTQAQLADMASAGMIVTPDDNPWILPASYVATVLRRSPATIRTWCAAGWYVGGQLLAKRVGGEWMIHGPRLAAYLAEETL